MSKKLSNKKGGSKRKNAPTPRAPKGPRGPRPERSLDPAGMAYARLLSDPCNAPLVHPTYTGSEGGYLLRSDSFVTIGNGATDTSGVFLFTPSILNNGGLGVSHCVSVGGSAGGTITSSGAVNSPGYSFLTGNADNVRCIAACLKITYPGSESGRSGRVHYGHLASAVAAAGGVVTPDSIAQLLPAYERTPASAVEVTWKPNTADQIFAQPSIGTDGFGNTRSATLACAWAGLPAAVGLTFHLTAVYEWQPKLNRGLSVPDLSKSDSNNDIDQVVNYLINRGYKFMHSAAMGLTANAVTGLATQFGLIGSGRTLRRGGGMLT